MRILRILTPLLCLPLSGVAQLTTAQKISDFNNLAALYAKNYGPYELRVQLYGYDLFNIAPWLTQVTNSKDDISFYDICTKYVAGLQDSHDEFLTPSIFEVWLHMDVDVYDGKVLIGDIDRGYLPSSKYPFAIGDELVSMDGTAAADLIKAFIPYAVNGSGNATSQARLAAAAITDRYQGWMPLANQAGTTATIVVKSQSTGNTATYTIPWDRFGTPLTSAGLLPLPHAEPAATSNTRASLRRPDRETGRNPWGVWTGPRPEIQPDQTPDYMQALKKLRQSAAVTPAVATHGLGLSPFDSIVPVFNPPVGFKLRLGAKSTDQFLSGTYPLGTNTIGFIRIPTFSPPNETTAINQFFSEILYFQANTDALVVDVMGNGGGDLCYGQAMTSTLIPKIFRGTSLQIRATLFWLDQISGALFSAQSEGAPPWVIALYNLYQADIQQALSENRGRTGGLPICDVTFDQYPPTDSKGNVLSYTKPILLLTDNFTLSTAETFSMFLQDNKRATVFGTRTDGGGGDVVEFDATPYSEGAARVTLGLIERLQPVQTPGFPLSLYYDGIGIYPDIVQDYQTLDNLLHGGATFVAAFNKAVANLISGGH